MLLTPAEITNACDWLLENAGPSIRYRTLTEILKRAPDNAGVQQTYSEILNSNRLKAITAKQNADGSFGLPQFHGPDTSEPYMRELFELGVRPDHPLIKKGIAYIRQIYKKHPASWIVGLFEEPLGRAGEDQRVIEWYQTYLCNFNDLFHNHRQDWLYTRNGLPSTFLYPGIPYFYVLRTLSHSWVWLKKYAAAADAAHILEFLLVDMADVHELYWDLTNNTKKSGKGVSVSNHLYPLTSGYLAANVPGPQAFSVVLEGLWLLAEFGVIEAYPSLLNAFTYITGKKNSDGLWEFPVDGMSKNKAMWVAYHGFSVEEDWRKKQSPIAELTFRVCQIASKHNDKLGSILPVK